MTPRIQGSKKRDRFGLVFAVLTILLWGSAFSGIVIGLESFSPGPLALLRFAVAALVLVPAALIAKVPIPRGPDLMRIGLLGLCGISAYHTLLNAGQQTVHPGVASLLIATTPFFTAFFSWLMRTREGFSGLQWAGSLLSFSGVLLVVLGGVDSFGLSLGSLMILGSAALAGVYFSVGKPLIDRYGALSFTSWSFALGTIPLFYFLPQLVHEFPVASSQSLMASIYIGIFPAGIAYLFWFFSIERIGPNRAVSFAYGIPVVAFIIAWATLSIESPTSVEMVGGLFVIMGVFLVNRVGNRAKKVKAS